MSSGTRLPRSPLEDDAAERRRVLNVLAQRRYRRRMKARLLELETAAGTSSSSAEERRRDGLPVLPAGDSDAFVRQGQCDEVLGNGGTGPEVGNSDVMPSRSSLVDTPLAQLLQDDEALDDSAHMQPFDYDLIAGRMVASDFADYAITIPGLSVLRAKLQISEHLHGSIMATDIWNPRLVSRIFLGQETDTSIAAFAPSILQKTIEHHPALDAMPWSSFRDRFLYMMTLPVQFRPKIAQQDMASLTLELMMAVKDAGGGLRVWGSNLFAVESWEIGPVFYSKFWWAIDNDIVRHSNSLRAMRGENPLSVADIEA